ncbi:peroxidase 52-like [Hibiscus syriacus]|uniref:Peroxidase 52-like n=1 Tax=Hibiscus syriacus TaxID=106335 RepID=A0A6A2YDR8_HIBSY|nr:peroxidase 52-like [Hibiscus syriacus]
MGAFQCWVSQHKLTAIGAVWASAIGASLAYNSGGRSYLKPSLRLIHARMHSQALTLDTITTKRMAAVKTRSPPLPRTES